MDAKDLTGQSAIHHAVTNGDIVLVDFLTQWNVDVNALDGNGHCKYYPC